MAYKKVILWGLILALCCTVGGAAVYLPVSTVPPISEQLPQNLSHLQVQIISPLRESRWPLNSFVPIGVQVQAAEPIDRVEVFINDTALEAQFAMGDAFSSVWMWQPGAQGDFVITARAAARSGLTSISAPVMIHTTAAGHTLSLVAVGPGETLQSIAEQKGIPVEEMQKSN